jgi:hypothetical protein
MVTILNAHLVGGHAFLARAGMLSMTNVTFSINSARFDEN